MEHLPCSNMFAATSFPDRDLTVPVFGWRGPHNGFVPMLTPRAPGRDTRMNSRHNQVLPNTTQQASSLFAIRVYTNAPEDAITIPRYALLLTSCDLDNDIHVMISSQPRFRLSATMPTIPSVSTTRRTTTILLPNQGLPALQVIQISCHITEAINSRVATEDMSIRSSVSFNILPC
jgi:hypothetical protein